MGAIIAEPIPITIPQKYPYPFKRHQYHFKTLAAVYPPNKPLVIHNVTWFTESTINPNTKPIITNTTAMI